MSYKATHWAWETDLPMTQKFVLVALADMADEAHSCFPGQERIARMIGATDRTVRAALTKLEADGFLTRIERRGSDGLRTSDRYVLHVYRKMLPVVESPEDDDRVTGISRRPHRKEIPGNHQRTTREPSDSSPRGDGGFAEFYLVYPRKVGKEAARRAFEKAAKSAGSDVIIAGARRFAADPNLPDKQFIPHPATWLNRGSWEDEPLPPRQQGYAPPAADQFGQDEWLYRS